jgi:hypothetical protein
MRITVCLHAATHEGVAHDREIAADTVDDTISLTRWFSCHQKTYLESGEVTHTDAVLDKIVEFVGRNPDGATAREVQQQVHLPSAELTKMYLDKLVPGRLTRVEVPPPQRKGWSYQGDLQVTVIVNFYGGPCYTCSCMEVPLTPTRGRR